MPSYDRSIAPKEGTSAISDETRRRIYGPQGGPTNNPQGGQGINPNYLNQEEGLTPQGQMLGGVDFGQLLLQLLSQTGRAEEALRARSYYSDPVAFERKEADAALARNPWGPGGLFEGRRAADLYSPEALLASQGSSAENQWAQMGGGRPGIDAEKVKQLTRVQPYRTYAG
jgi:hypothetical protein